MEHAGTLGVALGTAFGAGGIGIVVATRGSLTRLRESVLTRRYLTWLALAVAYGVPALFGRAGVAALATLLAVQAAREAAPLLGLAGIYRWALIGLCGLWPVLAFAGVGGWAIGAALLVAAGLPVARGRPGEVGQATGVAFGALLVGWTLAQLVDLAGAGLGWVALALFGTAISDVCAFAAGKLVGGPRLAPRVSPGKTWGGLGGNLVGAALALLLIAPMLPALAFPALAAIVIAIGLGGCGGDLIESALKRGAGVKDAAA